MTYANFCYSTIIAENVRLNGIKIKIKDNNNNTYRGLSEKKRQRKRANDAGELSVESRKKKPIDYPNVNNDWRHHRRRRDIGLPTAFHVTYYYYYYYIRIPYLRPTRVLLKNKLITVVNIRCFMNEIIIAVVKGSLRKYNIFHRLIIDQQYFQCSSKCIETLLDSERSY